MSRESWIGWTHAQLTTADNLGDGSPATTLA